MEEGDKTWNWDDLGSLYRRKGISATLGRFFFQL